MQLDQQNSLANDIKDYIPDDLKTINSAQIINVFDILLREKLITPQEHIRAVNRAQESFNK